MPRPQHRTASHPATALAFALGYGDRGRAAMQRLVRIKDIMVESVVTIGPDASFAEAAVSWWIGGSAACWSSRTASSWAS